MKWCWEQAARKTLGYSLWRMATKNNNSALRASKALRLNFFPSFFCFFWDAKLPLQLSLNMHVISKLGSTKLSQTFYLDKQTSAMKAILDWREFIEQCTKNKETGCHWHSRQAQTIGTCFAECAEMQAKRSWKVLEKRSRANNRHYENREHGTRNSSSMT